jgi:predicted alpha/beta hydrolase family esterase
MSTDVRYCANDDCAEEVEANCKWCKECAPVPEKLKVVIVPGNGCVPVEASNWYLWAQQELTKTGLFPGGVLLPTMPDAHKARRNIWIPFLLEHCKVDKNTVLIGHSSGAECGMRLLEKQRLAGVVLVAACHTDLGHKSEAISHYYPRSAISERFGTGDGGEWNWTAIKRHAGFIMQFHSQDDRFIEIKEARFVAAQLGSKFFEFTDRDHFFSPFPELISTLTTQLCHDKATPKKEEKTS